MNLTLQLKAAYYSILRARQPVVVRDNYGIKVRLYPYDKTPIKKLLTRENYKEEFLLYAQFAHGIVIDVGAHIGIHSVYLSRSASKVYAFEPVASTFELLKQTIELNHSNNVVPVRAALKDREGMERMNTFPPELSSKNTFGPSVWDAKVISEEVPVHTLDGFAKKNRLDYIEFLKIDAEGADLEVLLGAVELLKAKRIHVLCFEVYKKYLASSNKSAKQIFDFLSSLGYNSYEHNQETGRFEGPIHTSDAEFENYYASNEDLTRLNLAK
jgi:FkbM family methyltransferase